MTKVWLSIFPGLERQHTGNDEPEVVIDFHLWPLWNMQGVFAGQRMQIVCFTYCINDKRVQAINVEPAKRCARSLWRCQCFFNCWEGHGFDLIFTEIKKRKYDFPCLGRLLQKDTTGLQPWSGTGS